MLLLLSQGLSITEVPKFLIQYLYALRIMEDPRELPRMRVCLLIFTIFHIKTKKKMSKTQEYRAHIPLPITALTSSYVI